MYDTQVNITNVKQQVYSDSLLIYDQGKQNNLGFGPYFYLLYTSGLNSVSRGYWLSMCLLFRISTTIMSLLNQPDS